MAKLTLDDLKKLRQEQKKALDLRDNENKNVQVLIGMGTSGIANGAKQTLEAFLEMIEEQELSNVAVRQTGGLGLDYAEPTVEVRVKGMPNIIYGNVTPDVAKKIVKEHILGGQLVEDHIFDRPAADIVDTEETDN
jgi:NADP-reducing hydrogenase subunit HndB